MEVELILKNYAAYFIKPFPSTQGFAAYRFPGMLVHLPLFFIFLFLGLYLNLVTPWLRPFIALYIVIGLYLGRDIAIYAHYNPLIILAVICMVILSPFLITSALKPFKMTLGGTFPLFALVLDLGCLAAYTLYVRAWVKKAS